MPTYDYVCRECGHTFEQFQSITAGALRKCPKCSKLRLKRLIGSGAGIIFKGSGFYETDYRSESYQKDAARESESKSDAKATDKKDSKAADKPNKADKPSSKPKKPKKK